MIKTKVGTTNIDLSGKRFGKLIALAPTKYRRQGSVVWSCICDCGEAARISCAKLMHRKKANCGCEDGRRRLPRGEAGLRRLYAKYNTDSSKRGKIFGLSVEEFRLLTSSNCWYCGSPPSKICKPGGCSSYSDYLYNGIDRKDSSLGYFVENCLPCCLTCNIAKHTMSVDEFLSWVARVSQHHHPKVDRRI